MTPSASTNARNVFAVFALTWFAPIASGQTLYWADRELGTITRVAPDGTGRSVLVTGLTDPRGVAVDLAGGGIYWTEWLGGRLARADMDGGNVVTLATTPRSADVSLDLANRQVYWIVSGRDDEIYRANLDGTGEELLAVFEPTQMGRLALHLPSGKMYWTITYCHAGDCTPGKGRIQRANLDGSCVEDFITGLQGVVGIAIDPVEDMLYWTSHRAGHIARASLNDPFDIQVLIETGYSTSIAIDPIARQMYWTRDHAGEIWRANLDGTDEERLHRFFGRPTGLTVTRPPDCDSNGILDACELDCGPAGGSCDVDGCGTRSDCNQNLIPDVCDTSEGFEPDCNDNGIPDACEIDDESSPDVNGDGIPDECCLPCLPAALEAPPSEAGGSHLPKNRFLSFVVPSGAGAGSAEETAIQIELTTLNHVCSADSGNPFEPCTTTDDCVNGLCERPFFASECQGRYVNVVKTCQGGATSTGEVICRSLADCAIDEECLQMRTCDGTTDLCATRDDCPSVLLCRVSMSCPNDDFKPPFLCATTGCEPEYRDWASDLAGGVLHVYGPGIVPARSEYNVRQLSTACSGSEVSCASASDALMITTARWADMTADGATNAQDIAAASDKVKPIPSAFTKPRTMLIPGILDPFRNVNVLELQNTIDAVKSLPMPGFITGPEDCGT